MKDIYHMIFGIFIGIGLLWIVSKAFCFKNRKRFKEFVKRYEKWN